MLSYSLANKKQSAEGYKYLLYGTRSSLPNGVKICVVV